MTKPISLFIGFAMALTLAGQVAAQENLSAETAAPVAVPGNTMLGLAEAAASAGVADIQVATGQTLTNSVLNVAKGNTDIASAPFLLTFLLSKGAGPYGNIDAEEGAALADQLAVLYTYRFGVTTLSASRSANFGGWDAIEGARI